MSSTARKIVWLASSWIVFLAIYAALSLTHTHDPRALSTFGNIVQCLVPLLANAGLLLNAGTPHWRRNFFWMLLALSCTLWMIGQFQWTYYEVYLRKPVPDLNPGDIIFFVRGIPLMAALALQPHRKRGEIQLRFGYLDFALLLTWWTFVYAFVVLPWMYASPSYGEYSFNFNLLTNIQNMVCIGGLIILWLQSKGAWRVVYANLFGGAALYMLSSLVINVTLDLPKNDPRRYYTGSLFDLPLISSFLWFGLAGAIAYKNQAALDAPSENGFDPASESKNGEGIVAARLA